jgi:hypothetical protein
VGSWFDRDAIVVAMAQNDFDRVAAAAVVGCHPYTVTRQMQFDADVRGVVYVNQKARGGRARGLGAARIKWDATALMKLTAILGRTPIPRNAEVAAEMGVTLQALQTAMSRFGLSPHTRPTWDDKAMSKLAAILARKPTPPNKDIASEMGVTLPALQAAMTKFGLLRDYSKNVRRPEYQKEESRAENRRMRNCMCCNRPFGSEGINNRLCLRCGGMGSIDKESF